MAFQLRGRRRALGGYKMAKFEVIEGDDVGPGRVPSKDNRRLYMKIGNGIMFRLDEDDITRAISSVIKALGAKPFLDSEDVEE